MDWTFISLGIFALAFLVFARVRLLTYLRFFQQEEYDGRRFLHWVVSKRAFDRRASLLLLAAGLAMFLPIEPKWLLPLVSIVAALGFFVLSLREIDPRQHGKKRLAMTARAQRILWVSMGVCISAALLAVFFRVPVPAWIVLLHAFPLVLVCGNLLLDPYEKALQRRFWEEAHAKLVHLRPTIIGITGSFGKTSVKHILGHLLDSQSPTLITPGSVNTPMGIARIVRERLGPQHRFFVCEMGAYGPGSIARLCDLAPPDHAIITAIGRAHYERFGSLDAVARTKFELAEAAVARGGKIIVMSNVIEHAIARAFRDLHRDEVIVVGEDDAAMRITKAYQQKEGIVVEAIWQGRSYTLRAPLFGLHHCGNIAIAFATACVLGYQPEDMVTTLASMPQIKHRLDVSRVPAGWLLIDDAYNSNPVGFASALQLLDVLKEPGGRCILVTPGMVELGSAHDEEHARIGAIAAKHVDVLLPVVPERIGTLVENFRAAAAGGIVIPCRTFDEARTWLDKNATAKDIVLFENDLPDLYEAELRI